MNGRPQPDPVASLPDLVGRLGRELISLAEVWFELDPDDRRIAARSIGEMADDAAPALAAMRRSAPSWCIETTVQVHHKCPHPEAHR